MQFSEIKFVEWLTRRAPGNSSVVCGIGDDMAPLRLTEKNVLVSSDMLLDGVHFDSASQSLKLIGRKALASCLSDCAAMSVKPRAATISLAIPDCFGHEEACELFEGIFVLAEKFDVAVAGGDTTRWPHPLAIDVACVATEWECTSPVLRSGARAGDRLYVTGPLGGSLLGRHLTFSPRVIEAKQLAEYFGTRLHAMMDLSDGLSIDLWRMCESSGVGARLDEQMLSLAISDDAQLLAKRDDAPPLEHALHDGEDFELLLAIEGDAAGCDVALLQVGAIVESGYHLSRQNGTREKLEPKGFVH